MLKKLDQALFFINFILDVTIIAIAVYKLAKKYKAVR